MPHLSLLPVVCVTLLASSIPSLAEPTEAPVALHTAAGRYVTASPKGGLILGSGAARDRTTFTLIDTNGAALATGDPVQVRYGAGRGSSYWREDRGRVSRAGGRPDKTCLFRVKWKQKDHSLQLQAADGKFVAAPAPGQGLITAAASDPATVFDVVKNPAPQEARQRAAPQKTPAKTAGAPKPR